MTGLLHSPALPAPPSSGENQALSSHPGGTGEGRHFCLRQPCQHPVSQVAPCWIPRPPGEGVSSHAPQHSTPPTAEGACCPGHGLPLPWSGTVDKDLENHGGERRHPGPVWSRGSLRGPALNPSELQSLHAGTLGSAKSPLARPCETGIWKALSSPPARALDKWEFLLPPLKSHLHIRGPALW